MFLLFAGENYYAKGGLNDYIAMFSTQEEAVQQGKLLQSARNSTYGSVEWWHVAEISRDYVSIVARTESTPHGNPNDDSHYYGDIH